MRLWTTTTGAKFEKLVEIMATLRGPNGCPWDKQQDFNSLKPMLVEEIYEVLEAIENKDFDGLVRRTRRSSPSRSFFTRSSAKEAGQFDINTVIEKISDKLVRRHPHVFGNERHPRRRSNQELGSHQGSGKGREAKEPDAGTAFAAGRNSQQVARASRSPPDFVACRARRV